MKVYSNITEVVGNTPLVKINHITDGAAANVFAKLEFYNPTSTVKDRIGIAMVDAAEASGQLKPGGTIVEATSGNTGIALAMVGAARGYKTILTMPDSMSRERRALLRAFGAQLILTPAADGMKGAVAKAEELGAKGAVLVRQFENAANPEIHRKTTAQEIWNDTEGQVAALVAGIGTGGTITGVGQVLKEKNPNIEVLGIDTYGSVFKKYKETGIFDKNEIYPYITEGIGEDFLPANVDFSIIDHFEKVTDKDAAVMTRRIPREEGIFVGNSAGSALAGILQMRDRFKPTDVVVVIFHDHGTRYLGKMYNEDWMRDRGFIAPKSLQTATDLIQGHAQLPLLCVNDEDPCEHVIHMMQKFSVSQLPVKNKNGDFVGAVEDAQLYAELLKNRDLMNGPVSVIMSKPYPIVSHMATIEEVSSKINKNNAAVLMMDMGGNWHIITKQDLIQAIAKGN